MKIVKSITFTIILLLLYHTSAKVAMATTEIQSPRVEYGVSTWDTIYFGNFYQENDVDKTPILWRVLSVNDHRALVLSEYLLKTMQLDAHASNPDWKNCMLRSWLNECFMEEAFSGKEQNAIITTHLKNDWHMGGGGFEDTDDKIFILSMGELSNREFGFDEDFSKDSETRVTVPTSYGFAGDNVNYQGAYWVRNDYSSYADWGHTYVTKKGVIPLSAKCIATWNNTVAVRPAMTIDLTKADYTYAGTISKQNSLKPPILPIQEELKTIVINKIELKKGSKVIKGTLSVSNAIVNIKVGNREWKRAKVNKKFFQLKTRALKKGTKVKIQVKKMGYKTLMKTVKIK